MRNKGQMFLIASIIIIAVLILLKTSINLPEIIQQKIELEGRFDREFFASIVDEMPKVIEISYHQQDNITNNIFDFFNFTIKKMDERSLDFETLFVDSITPKETGVVTMNVTLINLLKKSINATLILDGSIKNQDNIADMTAWYTDFTVTQGENYTLTVSYNETYQENITINTYSEKSRYIAFFDITIESLRETYKDKFQKSYTLP